LEKHWEPLFFIEEDPGCVTSEALRNHFFATQLSFWLAKPFVLGEIIEELANLPLAPIAISNAIYCLIELGDHSLAYKYICQLADQNPQSEELLFRCQLLEIAIMAHQKSLEEAFDSFMHIPTTTFAKPQERVMLHLLEMANDHHKTSLVHQMMAHLENFEFSSLGGLYIKCAHIRSYMLDKDWQKAGEILLSYPIELLSQETTPLHFLYGCWLYAMEGREIAEIHFNGILEVSYPRTWTLFGHYFNGKIVEGQGWFEKAFLWEKRQIYRQLSLYNICIGNSEEAVKYELLAKKENVSQ
jgi:serine/threonine-protein kinase